MKKFCFVLLTMLSVLSVAAQELPVTAAPTITYVESQNGYTIDVQGAGMLTVELYRLDIGGDEQNQVLFSSAQAIGTYQYFISRPYEMEGGFECVVKAIAQEDGMLPSAEVIEQFLVRPFFLMPTPEIVFTEEEAGLYIDVNGQGRLTVNVSINGQEMVVVDQLPFFVPRTYEEQTIFVEAISDGYGDLDVLPSGVTQTYVLEAAVAPPDPLVTPKPQIVVEEQDDCVIISAYDTHNAYAPDDPFGEVEVYLYIDGQQVENPCVVPRTYEIQDLGISAYAVSLTNQDAQPSEVAYIVYLVEPLEMVIEQTAAPTVAGISIDNGYIVALSEMESSSIYYRIGVWKEFDYQYEFGDWMFYESELLFEDEGRYRIEAYAIADGKEMSAMIAYEFVLVKPTPSYVYDFEEDGIFYKITAEGKVSVCSETTDYNSYSGQVDIPATVTHDGVTYMVTGIKEDAFRGCTGLTGVTIGAYVTTIGNTAFYCCSRLTSVTLGDYVITLGSQAFAGCSNLESVTLGSGLASIGSRAFDGCPVLTSVTCKAATPPVMAASDCFNCYATATLHVYPPVLDSYQAANYWNQFANIVAEDNVAPAQGDMNGDGRLNITDVTSLINMLLTGQ